MQKIRDLGLHDKIFIIVGVGPLASARSAQWIRSNVPGVHIPDSIIERLKGADNPKAEGQTLCVELIQQIREIEGVDGVHVMAYKQEHTVPDIVTRSGVLDGRTTWHPRLYDGDATVQQHQTNIQ